MECKHRRCDGELVEHGADPLLPDFVTLYGCPECGELYEYDEDDDSWEIG